MLVSFGEWRPDVAELNGAFIGDARNVLPSSASYIPFPDVEPISTPLPQAPAGRGIVARTLGGQITAFAGSSGKLWRYDSSTLGWVDVSRSGGAYSANIDAQWDFAQFGDFVIAVNANDDPQVFELGVSTTFANLAGAPPRASFVRVWGDFVALECLAGNENRVHWSALNDITGWTPGVNNSDYQTFPDGGRVQGSTEATNPIILMERAIYLGTFVPGSVEIFTFNKAHDKRGAKSAYSIVSRGAFAFYVDEGGFFQIGADGSIRPIGFQKVDDTVFKRIASNEATQIIGAIDPFYSRVYWAFRMGPTAVYNRLIVYDWDLAKWSIADVNLTTIFPLAAPGYTLEGLDTVSSTLEGLPFSLDSKIWQSGAPFLASFSSDARLGSFTGSNKEALLTTQETGDTAGQVTTILSSTPVIDALEMTVAIGSRLRRYDQPVWTSEQYPSSNTGKVRKKSRGRFHRLKVRIMAGELWSHAQGVDVDLIKSGQR